MPCIPKILRDTGVLKNIKRAFGMKTTTTKTPSNSKSGQFSSNVSHSKSATVTSKSYYKLDEDGIPLEPVESESTEQLHKAKPGGLGITRTTQITVSQDSRSVTGDVEAGHGAPRAHERPARPCRRKEARTCSLGRIEAVFLSSR